jgi:hypothetical protein
MKRRSIWSAVISKVCALALALAFTVSVAGCAENTCGPKCHGQRTACCQQQCGQKCPKGCKKACCAKKKCATTCSKKCAKTCKKAAAKGAANAAKPAGE